MEMTVSPQSPNVEAKQILSHLARLLEQAERQPPSGGRWRALLGYLRAAQQSLAGDLAGPSRSLRSAETVTFSPSEAIVEVAEVMAPLAAETCLRFDWTVDADLPPRTLGDKALLQEALRGLLNECIRNSHDRHLRLTAGSTLSGGSVQLRVALTGAPPAAEFSPDLRALQAALADAGGTLTASQDATLCLTFPLGVPAVVSTQVDGKPSMRILVAEDSDESFQLIELYSASEGHKLSRAWNGVEAVAMAKTGAFDLIVMDLGMPAMDGHQATRLIREWETEQGHLRVPILLFSATSDEQQIRLGAAVGCSGYLAKPATQRQLLAALRFYSQPAAVPDPVH